MQVYGSTLASVGKIIAAIFWDVQEILLIGYLERGHTTILINKLGS